MNEKEKNDNRDAVIGCFGLLVIIAIVVGIVYWIFFAPSKLQKEYPGVVDFTIHKEWNGNHNTVLGHYGVLEYKSLTDQEIVNLCENYFPKKKLEYVILEKYPDDVYGYHIGIMDNPKEDIISQGFLSANQQYVQQQLYFVGITKDNKLSRIPWQPGPIKTPSNWE